MERKRTILDSINEQYEKYNKPKQQTGKKSSNRSVSYSELRNQAEEQHPLDVVSKYCYILDNFNNLSTSADKRRAIKDFDNLIDKVPERLDREYIIQRFKEVTKINLIKQDSPNAEGLKLTNYFKNIKDIYHKKHPFFYDRNKIFWQWNHDKYRYEIKDEVDIINDIDKLLSFGGELVTTTVRNNYLNACKDVGRQSLPKDPQPSWVQFKDTIINIETNEVFTASPNYFFTNPIPWKLGETDDTPTMDKILKEWVGDKYIDTLYEIIAYCLLTEYPIHRLFCFIGSGLNGKSKFMNLIAKFVGENNICSTELDTLLVSRFEAAKLHKKLVCMMGETNFNEMDKTSMLKKLTGQDLIGFEYKQKMPFQGYNYAKIFIATNNLPSTSDKTEGFYRRWLIMDFPHKFSEKKDILSTIPDEEYENLARKSVKMLNHLLIERSFTNEGSIAERRRIYEEKSNPFDKFWSDNVLESYEGNISKSDFRRKLEEWCLENGFRKIGDRTIMKHMQNKGIETARVTADWFNSEGEQPRYMAWTCIKWKDL